MYLVGFEAHIGIRHNASILNECPIDRFIEIYLGYENESKKRINEQNGKIYGYGFVLQALLNIVKYNSTFRKQLWHEE